MANEKDVFEVPGPFMVRTHKFSDKVLVVVGPSNELWSYRGYTPDAAAEVHHEADKLNAAYQLGYRAALMEKA